MDHLQKFAEICVSFYGRLRAAKCPRLLAYLLVVEFLRVNLRMGAAMSVALETKQPMTYPGIKH